MMSFRTALICLAAFTVTLPGWCSDWITEPSYYSHDQSGQRVQQYTPIGPFYIYPTPGFQRSGYHHTRSSLQVGSSADHFHQVEEWGRPVRPYDEWRFPTRPYSVPYDLWGPPYGGLGSSFGRGYYGAPGFGLGAFLGGLPGVFPGGFPGVFPGGFPGGDFNNGGPGGNVPYRGYQPWFDDRYPAFDDRAPFRQQPFPQVAP